MTHACEMRARLTDSLANLISGLGAISLYLNMGLLLQDIQQTTHNTLNYIHLDLTYYLGTGRWLSRLHSDRCWHQCRAPQCHKRHWWPHRSLQMFHAHIQPQINNKHKNSNFSVNSHLKQKGIFFPNPPQAQPTLIIIKDNQGHQNRYEHAKLNTSYHLTVSKGSLKWHLTNSCLLWKVWTCRQEEQ